MTRPTLEQMRKLAKTVKDKTELKKKWEALWNG